MLVGHVLDERQGESALMSHETDGRLIHHLVKDHEIVVLQTVLRALEVAIEVIFQLGLLLMDVGEIDEEPGAHVAFHVLDLLRLSGFVAFAQEVAVLEKTSSSDLLGIAGGDLLVVEMAEGLVKIAKHAFTHDGGIEVLTNLHLSAIVVEEQRVQENVEGIHGELVLAAHMVNKL